MYLHNTFSRGLLNFATPLFEELEKPHARWEGFFDPAFAEEDGDYVFEVEMPGFSKNPLFYLYFLGFVFVFSFKC